VTLKALGAGQWGAKALGVGAVRDAASVGWGKCAPEWRGQVCAGTCGGIEGAVCRSSLKANTVQRPF